MTDDEYIELCAERAREEARRNLKSADFIKPFNMVIKSFMPHNSTQEEFIQQLRDMGDNETQIGDLAKLDEE